MSVLQKRKNCGGNQDVIDDLVVNDILTVLGTLNVVNLTVSGSVIATNASESFARLTLATLGTSTPSNAMLYLNPTSTVYSGANNYYYSYLKAPPSTGSTTGVSSTLYIDGAPANATTAFAINVNAGSSYLGGGVISTTGNFTDGTASTSATTGALTLLGGIGLNNSTDSVSNSNGGSFTTTGGMSIAKTLRVKDVIISNSLTSSNTPYLAMQQSGTFAVGRLTVTNCTFNTTDFTNGTNVPTYSLGAFTINQTGRYLICYTVIFGVTASGCHVQAWIQQDASAERFGNVNEEVGLLTSNNHALSGSTVLTLTATHKVVINLFHDDTGNVNVGNIVSNQTNIQIILLN